MTDDKINNTTKNRKFVESYVMKGDGGLADKLVRGMKKHFQEWDAITPAEKWQLRRGHKKKMAEIVTGAKNYPGYDAIFPKDKLYDR